MDAIIREVAALKKDVIRSSVEGRDVIGILPTGWGISAIHIFDRFGDVIIVISPLTTN